MCNDKKWPSDIHLRFVIFFIGTHSHSLAIRFVERYDPLRQVDGAWHIVCVRVSVYGVSCKYENIFSFYTPFFHRKCIDFFFGLIRSGPKMLFAAQKFMCCNGLHNNTELNMYMRSIFRLTARVVFQTLLMALKNDNPSK